MADKGKSQDSKTMRDPKASKQEKSAAAKDLGSGSKGGKSKK